MIDTHAHILPAMDDGATDQAQSMAFAERAANQGVKVVCATPHVNDGVHNCIKADILAACRALSAQLVNQGFPIQVVPGAEVRLTHDLLKDYDNGRLLTFNDAGRWLLVELPDLFIAKAVCLTIRQLADRGVTPIIAHAERNPTLWHEPEQIDAFVRQGARIQITAGSLTGDYGPLALKASKTMVKKDQVFCLGSDIHPGRKYRMAAARKAITKWAGEPIARRLTHDNAEAIIQDIDLTDTWDRQVLR